MTDLLPDGVEKARIKAVQAFLGDLLIEWKRVEPVGGVVLSTESGTRPGLSHMAALAASFEDVQKVRIALEQRGVVADGLRLDEQRISRELKKALRSHPVYPWLEPRKGLAGPLTARLMGLIVDPHTFPGWNPKAKTLLLQPDGIADQIIRHRTDPYRGIYDLWKQRLTERHLTVVDE